jgi:hypothetical protein
MPEWSEQSLQIFAWLAGITGIIWIALIPGAYLLAELILSIRLKWAGPR